MGVKIQNAFNTIMKVATISERMAVSMKAGIPSNKASSIPDNAKNLMLMKQAVNEVFNDLPNPQIKAKKRDILATLQ